MEAIKNVALEPVRRQVEILTSTSSTSKTQKQNVGSVDNLKKDAQNVDRIKEATNEKINRIAEAMDSYIQSIQRDLKIQVHEETGKIMVKITSEDGSKVIREIPPKELLDLAARMEELTGTLYDEKV
ncbi:MAG: flagellar protein FlaG [Desulfobacteraceae bacterium]|jgi:flagellar protein FlaG